jgi:4-hydroxy-tetrahydrodipicolinate synthase
MFSQTARAEAGAGRLEPVGGHCRDREGVMKAGVHAAMLTPLEGDGGIDHRGFARHARWLLDSGCDGVVPFGTTGEFPSFTGEERMAAIDRLVAAGLPADRIVVGTGSAAVRETARLSRHAMERGCAGVLVVPPFYFKEVSEDGLFAAFAEIVERAGEAVRIHLYHFPAMSAVPVSLGLLERLVAAYPRQIAGVKDSSGNFDNTRSMIERFPSLAIFTGDDDLLLPLLRAGGAGSITAGANIAANHLAAIRDGWRGGAVEERHRLLQQLWSGLLLKYPVTEALKEILAAETGDTRWLAMRAPLCRIPEPGRGALLAAFRALPFALLESQRAVLGDTVATA